MLETSESPELPQLVGHLRPHSTERARFTSYGFVVPLRAGTAPELHVDNIMMANHLQILLVDDDPAIQRLLRKWLETAGYFVVTANDGREAQQLIQDNCPQLLITDWEMPVVDGLNLCRWLRQQDTQNYVYTIFLTCRTASEDMITALESGADDFIKKPVDKGELLARVRSAARVLELESRLSILARTDPLTGLITRRTFVEVVEREWARADRHLFPISCVMLDIDYFKRINDSYGHRAGDHALRGIARILQQSCRGSDVVGRYGGEEFCVLLPETTEDQALRWADRVRQTIVATPGLVPNADLALTASFGVAQRMADSHTAEELVDFADQALLVAKRSGRNRVVGFQSVVNTNQGQESPTGPSALFQDKLAKDVMATIVAGLKQDDTVGSAAQYFLRFRFNSAPVVDEDGKLVGILSERDVMSIMLWPNWWKTRIKDVMRCNVVCYEENTPVLLIYEFLCRVSIRGVVIVRDGRPVGMISRASLLRWFTNMLSLSPVRSNQEPPAGIANDVIDVPVLPADPRENMAMIARAILGEASHLEAQLRADGTELIPAVVGGVSRMEELINDLLSFSRYVAPDSDAVSGNQSEFAAGIANLIKVGAIPEFAI